MYMPAYAGNPRNPRHPVDFVDFVDIFRKSLKLLCFSTTRVVDILWIFSWTVDLSVDLRARKTKSFQNGNGSKTHDRRCWIAGRPTLARKKVLDDNG